MQAKSERVLCALQHRSKRAVMIKHDEAWYNSHLVCVLPTTNALFMSAPALADIKRILRQHLPELRERYQVDTLGLFGSYVRREERPDSDLDVLVTFREIPGLLKLITLENELSDLLGVKVDLVVEDALKPRIGERVQREVERL